MPAAEVAQLVEQSLRKGWVASSSLAFGSRVGHFSYAALRLGYELLALARSVCLPQSLVSQ